MCHTVGEQAGVQAAGQEADRQVVVLVLAVLVLVSLAWLVLRLM